MVARASPSSTHCALIPVSDVGTRVAGVRAGDYDYAESIPGDLFAELDADASVKTMLNGGPIFGLVFLNSSDGPLERELCAASCHSDGHRQNTSPAGCYWP